MCQQEYLLDIIQYWGPAAERKVRQNSAGSTSSLVSQPFLSKNGARAAWTETIPNVVWDVPVWTARETTTDAGKRLYNSRLPLPLTGKRRVMRIHSSSAVATSNPSRHIWRDSKTYAVLNAMQGQRSWENYVLVVSSSWFLCSHPLFGLALYSTECSTKKTKPRTSSIWRESSGHIQVQSLTSIPKSM